MAIYSFISFALLLSPTLGIVCNGDFEGYGLVWDPTGPVSSYFNSNYSCWYNAIGNEVKIKLFSIMTTSVTELTHSFRPCILCQDVVLAAGKSYRLSFNIYNQPQVTSSTVFVKINNNTIYNFTTLNPSNFTLTSTVFMADTNLTQLCFDQTVVLLITAPIGVCLDNITLN